MEQAAPLLVVLDPVAVPVAPAAMATLDKTYLEQALVVTAQGAAGAAAPAVELHLLEAAAWAPVAKALAVWAVLQELVQIT